VFGIVRDHAASGFNPMTNKVFFHPYTPLFFSDCPVIALWGVIIERITYRTLLPFFIFVFVVILDRHFKLLLAITLGSIILV
jgi:hypothetical protein